MIQNTAYSVNRNFCIFAVGQMFDLWAAATALQPYFFRLFGPPQRQKGEHNEPADHVSEREKL